MNPRTLQPYPSATSAADHHQPPLGAREHFGPARLARRAGYSAWEANSIAWKNAKTLKIDALALHVLSAVSNRQWVLALLTGADQGGTRDDSGLQSSALQINRELQRLR